MKVYGIFLAAWLVMVSLLVAIGAALFDYCLETIFGVDAPWYLDVCGSLVCNGALLPIGIGCLIAQACGVPAPFFG